PRAWHSVDARRGDTQGTVSNACGRVSVRVQKRAERVCQSVDARCTPDYLRHRSTDVPEGRFLGLQHFFLGPAPGKDVTPRERTAEKLGEVASRLRLGSKKFPSVHRLSRPATSGPAFFVCCSEARTGPIGCARCARAHVGRAVVRLPGEG